MLVSLWGGRWHEVQLVMFTLYIDDSGTSPSQSVAIATALVIPAVQIIRLEKEWNTFTSKEEFKCFHTAEFMARNPNSEFVGWNDTKHERVFRRVKQISKKYGVRALSIAVNKKDYDEVVSVELRSYLGKDHYSWAVRQLLAHLHALFPPTVTTRREFIFQWIERHHPARKEIEDTMDQMQFVGEQQGAIGDYSDPHFRKSNDIPGLQCVDAVSWISYQYAVHLYRRTPLKKFVSESWKEFGGHLGSDGWLRALTIRRVNLERSTKKAASDGKAMKFFQEWKEARGR